jgi:hypothetical protein
MEDVKQIPPEKDRGGTWVTFGGESYKVPPLSFAAIKRLKDQVQTLAQVTGQPTTEQMDVVLDVVHSAMSRNYPSLTQDAVAEMVDLDNFSEVLGAVLRIAGFKPREQGEEGGGSGEAVASTGTASTSP